MKRKLWSLLCAAALLGTCLIFALLGGPSSASAAPSAPTLFGEVAESEVPLDFANVNDIAVDQKSGDFYVAVNNEVEKLSPYGAFILVFGAQVDETKVALRKEQEANSQPVTVTPEEESVCTAASGDSCSESGRQGSAAGDIGKAAGVAVEEDTGDVFVDDANNHRIDKFSSSGHFLMTFGMNVNEAKAEKLASPPSANEQAEANLCVAGEECQAGEAGSAEGAFESLGARPGNLAGSAKVIAIGGPAAGELVYVGDKARIEVFHPNGEFVEQLLLSSISATAKVIAIAADSAGDVFLAEENVAGVHEAVTNGGGALELSTNVFDASSTGLEALGVNGGDLDVADSSPTLRMLEYAVGNPGEAPAEFANNELNFELTVDPASVFSVEASGVKGIAVNGAGAVVAHAPVTYSGYLTGTGNWPTGYHSSIGLYGSLTAMEGSYGAPPPLRPTIGGEEVHAGAEATTVTLEAQINPELRATNYQFEYGRQPCSTGGCAKAPASLPDGRVYELVSPANKYGNFVDYEQAVPSFVSESGDAVMYNGSGALAASSSNATKLASVVSERARHGWVTRSTIPPVQLGAAEPEEYAEKAAVVNLVVPSTDLSHLLFTMEGNLAFAGAPDEAALHNNLYLAGPNPLLEPAWVGRSQIEGQPGGEGYKPSSDELEIYVAGTSSDLSTIYFSYKNGKLLPGASELYEYRDGVLSDAGALPGEEAATSPAAPAAQAVISTSDEVQGTQLTSPSGFDNEVSADGSRVFFVRNDGAGALELYVHVTARDGSQKTELVSHSQLPGHEGEPATDGPHAMPSTAPVTGWAAYPEHGQQASPPAYVFASPDGSHAFFQSVDRLTEEAPEDTSPKTYDFDVETGDLKYVPTIVGSIVSVSNDGSSLLFENTTTTPFMLDRWVAGEGGGSVTDIATLPSVTRNGCRPVLCVAPAFTSDNGEVSVFALESPIPGFNDGGMHLQLEAEGEIGFEAPQTGAGLWPNSEIFRYDAATDELNCVSCPPTHQTPTSNAIMSRVAFEGNSLKFKLRYVDGPGRGMNADASEIFFETRDALVPQDVNGTSDVYEWQDGEVSLISGGRESTRSLLDGVSESGNDVFFTTAEGIAAGDTDGAYDVYDARVPRPGDRPVEVIPCEGAVCQGPPSVPNLLSPPASEAFNGPGNLTPALKPSGKGKPSHGKQQRKAGKECAHKSGREARRRCKRKARHGARNRCAKRGKRAVSTKRTASAKRKCELSARGKSSAKSARRHGRSRRGHHHNGRGK